MSAVGEHVQLFLGEHEREQADRSLPHGEVFQRTEGMAERDGSGDGGL